MAHRAIPQERVRIGVAGGLDVGQLEHRLGNRLQLGALGGIQAVGRDLGFDDRHGLRNAVAHEHVTQQDLRRQRTAGQFGQRREAVSVHMREQQAAAVLGGGVGHRNGGQTQCLGEKGERVDHPARVLGAGHVYQCVGLQHEAAPGRQGSGDLLTLGFAPEGHQGGGLRFFLGTEEEQLHVVARFGWWGLEAHHCMVGQRLQRGGRSRSGLQPQLACQAGRGCQSEPANHGHGHLVGQLPLYPGRERRLLAFGQVAREAEHDACIAIRQDRFGQRLQGVAQLHGVAQVVQGHLQEPVRHGVVDRRRLLGVVDHQHLACHRLDAAYAHAGQLGIADPGGEPVGQDLLGRGACQRAVVRRHIVDHQDRQAMALAYLLQLAQQPATVGLGDFFVLALGSVPAAIERLGGHPFDLAWQLRHDVEATVQHEPDARKPLVQPADQLHQALLLRLFVKALGQAVRVQRVQEKATVALCPQRCNHAGGKKLWPTGGTLVDQV